ncbi:MAG: hypothetical protein ABWY81_05710, partial [Jiangellaceae bacterium]
RRVVPPRAARVARRDHAAAVRRGPRGLTGGRPELPATSPSLTIDFPSNFYFLAEGKVCCCLAGPIAARLRRGDLGPR